MVGSRPVGSGFGSTRLNTPQGVQQETVLTVPRVGEGLQPENTQIRNVGMGSVGSVQSEPVLPSLSTPRVLQPEGAAVRRALGLELEGSIEEIVSRLSAGGSTMVFKYIGCFIYKYRGSSKDYYLTFQVSKPLFL